MAAHLNNFRMIKNNAIFLAVCVLTVSLTLCASCSQKNRQPEAQSVGENLSTRKFLLICPDKVILSENDLDRIASDYHTRIDVILNLNEDCKSKEDKSEIDLSKGNCKKEKDSGCLNGSLRIPLR